MMKYRHELKYAINKRDAEILKQRLSYAMDVDTNANSEDNTYLIRSLYFDDEFNSAYYEKLDGVEFRKKYRIRIYNYSDDFIRLECKYKINNLTSKKQILITRKIYDNLIKGIVLDEYLKEDDLLRQFCIDMKTKLLRPSIIVDYKRLAYTYPISEVRVTFDEEISSGHTTYDIFDTDALTPKIIPDGQVILEVKFNEVLPEHIANIISSFPATRQAYSKFANCRSIK